MDEQSFRDLLQSAPGDRLVLEQYADWLMDRGDPRGPHLHAELAVYRAEDELHKAQSELTKHRRRYTEHFDWLNAVFPLRTFSFAAGTIYRSAVPDEPPLVEVGAMVAPDTRIAIVESQKIFYSIPAGHGGLVTEVLFQDKGTVDVGDCLLHIIRPQRNQIPVQSG